MTLLNAAVARLAIRKTDPLYPLSFSLDVDESEFDAEEQLIGMTLLTYEDRWAGC